jgi:hypothetical protein
MLVSAVYPENAAPAIRHDRHHFHDIYARSMGHHGIPHRSVRGPMLAEISVRNGGHVEQQCAGPRKRKAGEWRSGLDVTFMLFNDSML